MAYKAGRGKHAVQEQVMKQAQVLVDNDIDFLIAEVGMVNILVPYIEDISWPRGDTNFIFEC